MDKVLGIIGGGQLGKMLLQYVSRLSLTTHVYDQSNESPCKNLCNSFSVGSFMDYDKILEFGRKCNIVTFEIEHVNVEALKQLEKENITVYPRASTLEIIQNKNTQKDFFVKNSIPTSKFSFYKNLNEVRKSIYNNTLQLPCVWKKTTMGYDGYGVKIIKNIYDLEDLSLSNDECIIEEYIKIDKEISVITARNPSKEIKSYSPVEMIFNQNSNQVEYVKQPVHFSNSEIEKINTIVNRISENLNHVGILAVELFISNYGDILVNELAPRPHNSGHLTLESCCPTSQFEQHIRSILDLPLGNTDFTEPAIMLNLVGEKNHQGIAKYTNIEEIFKLENTKLHIYGKKETRPNRKMGHITMVGGNNLLIRAKNLKDKVKVIT
jgi:5-(carboxyamino)imidazole ribonucleotide synthase